MVHSQNNFILADGRWGGAHGIGRFSTEVLSRLNHTDILTNGSHPLSIKNLFWQSWMLQKKQSYKIFFTPGFNPSLFSSIPFVLTIHDLIHLHLGESNSFFKKLFYQFFIKPAAKKAFKIITVSDYSKRMILNWVDIPPEKVVVVSNGVSAHFTTHGHVYQPGFPYLLHVGNTKAHKNVPRLLQAFAHANIDSKIKLILTGKLTHQLAHIIQKNNLATRIIFCSELSDEKLADYYRGALGLCFPSLYEGYGLPVLEAMACGIPVLTSQTTSLPEVAGDAAIFIDPDDVNSITQGIEELVNNVSLRKNLIDKGLKRSTMFSWEKTAKKVQAVLDEICNPSTLNNAKKFTQ